MQIESRRDAATRRKRKTEFERWLNDTQLSPVEAAAVLRKSLPTIYQWRRGEREPCFATKFLMRAIARGDAIDLPAFGRTRNV